MEALLLQKHPASATVSQASWEARLHLSNLLLQRLPLLQSLLLSPAVRVRSAMVSRPDMGDRLSRLDMVSRLDMESRPGMVSSLPLQPSKLKSRLLLVPTATLVLRRVLKLIHSPLDTTSP